MNLMDIKKLFDNAYMAPVLGTAAILYFLKYLQIVFDDSPPLLLFLVVINFAAWSGGLRVGLFTTVLSAVASACFLEAPYGSLTVLQSKEIVRLILLVIVGAICSLTISHLHKREKRALQTVLEREKQLKREVAERNRTLAERDLYLSFAKSSTEFISMCDTNGMPFFINDAGLNLVGLDSLQQGLETPIKEFFFPEDQLFIRDKFFPEVCRDGRGESEIRLRHFKTGEALWMIHNVFVLKDLNGEKIGLGAVSTNITKRKKTEEALRLIQRDLNHAQAVAHIGSWRLDVRNNELEWSDENFRIFGVPEGTPLNYQAFLEIVHPDDRDFVDTAWNAALTGKPYDIEHRIIVGDSVKWLREQVELEFDPQGSLLGGFGTTEDITDIKSHQEALQQERGFLRQVIDAVPSVIFVKDREGRFLLGNEALARSYGTSTENLIGLTEESFNSNADERTFFYRNDIDVISTRKTKLIPDVKVTHADGSIHWYNTVKIPLIDDDQCNKLLVVASNITERKQAEESLRLADKRKDEFLAMLAHELRNPLAPIQNAVQLLKMQEAADPKLSWCHNVIDRQVTHISLLLDDLLDMARITQGKIRLKIERVDLVEIVNNAVETSRPLIESRRQALTVSPMTVPQWLEGDRVRLAQVLSNLLNNAAKYTGEGGQIALNVRREEAYAVLEIKDTGIGIAPDVLPRIFDLFTQADHSLAHSLGGLGIGLTLVRQLVELHGGTVTAESAGMGLGSLFTVRLPVLAMELPVTEFTPVDAAPPPSKLRILVVDDYADSAFSTMMLLQTRGHEV
jgi:PAS domain S-box-containing protein